MFVIGLLLDPSAIFRETLQTHSPWVRECCYLYTNRKFQPKNNLGYFQFLLLAVCWSIQVQLRWNLNIGLSISCGTVQCSRKLPTQNSLGHLRFQIISSVSAMADPILTELE